EDRAPLFQFANPVRSFLRVELCHAVVVKEFSAAHGVAEVRAPVVSVIDVCHSSRDAAFGHYGVGFAEKRFADDTDRCPLRESFDGCAQTSASSTNDENVVLVGFEFIGQKSLTSRMAPLATRRM